MVISKRKKLILTANVAVVGFIAGATVTGTAVSQAAENKVVNISKQEKRGRVVMPPAKTLSLNERIQWQRSIVKHDQWVLKTAKSHSRSIVKWHRAQLSWTRRELKTSLSIWYSRFHATWPSLGLSSFPPHHSLWMCIHGDPNYGSHYGLEASTWDNKDTGRNGHWGGLQMHPGWGYGTSYHASDDSQLTQEWAAERGYRASGYSHTWLMGQWAHYQCLKYA